LTLVLKNPATYEILNPADFGLSRYVHFASRLTGWNAIKSRSEQLGIYMSDDEYKQCTLKIKAIADVRKLGLDDTDAIIHDFHRNLQAQKGKQDDPLTPASEVPETLEQATERIVGETPIETVG